MIFDLKLKNDATLFELHRFFFFREFHKLKMK
ncbi:hypothetical protein FLA105534_03233 [Flavobacterium bizetiae]|nr:hypothetical protein FLA105534_03233 [Flavobacterium bizetiae]